MRRGIFRLFVGASAATAVSASGCQDVPSFRDAKGVLRDCAWAVQVGECSQSDNLCPLSCGLCNPERQRRAASDDAVLVTEECYLLMPAGDQQTDPTAEIMATFSNPKPSEGDWMGIYPAGTEEPLGDPLAWKFLCDGGDVYRSCEASRGSVSFPWKESGAYEAVLVHDPYPPYRPYSRSAAFRVAEDCISSSSHNIFLRGGGQRRAS